MTRRGIHLRYTFEALGQDGAHIENPLFDLLSAMQAQGSIAQAAQALSLSYRHVWGSLKHWEAVLGTPLVLWSKGRHARLTPFAERLLWAERQARARMAPHVEALRTELQRVFARAEDPALQWLEVFASHDLGLPRLQALAEEQQGLHIGLRFAGSEEALRALHDGRCSVAGFHVPRLPQGSALFRRALRPLLKPGVHKLIGSHWRRQGLMLRHDLPPGSTGAAGGAQAAAGAGQHGGALQALPDTALLQAIATGQGRFVNRQPGSGTRLLLDHLLTEAGLPAERIDGYATRVESTHMAVAAAVASGAADVGLGIEAVADGYGLRFVPLAEEDYFLVCMKPALDSPAVASLRRVLASPAWAQALAALPGYGVQAPGQVLSLTRALPWWRYRQPKGPPGAAA